MMKWAILLIAVLVLASGCVSEGFRGTTVTGNEIVFASDLYSTNNELYLMNDDGTNIRRLTWNEWEDNNPAFSRDKKKIAFHRAENPSNLMTYEIYILDLETGKETRITDNDWLDGHPDWNPDGTKLVFTRYEGSNADLYVADLTGEEVRLTETPWEENDAEWSPDGTKIAFKSTEHTNESGKDEIYVMDSDGTNTKRLTNVSGWQSDHDPSWSSDSGYVYFERFEGVVPWYQMTDILRFLTEWKSFVPWNVYMVDLNGSLDKITNCSYICWLPVQYNDNVMFLRDDFGLVNETLITVQVDYATILPDGTEQKLLLTQDEYKYKKAYFDF